ncbi:MAG: hypothetical protein PHE26_12115 [Syntrophomonadaceae bacterium]|nr:hypothetical protein [Syntrophomonadaceae bacterium]
MSKGKFIKATRSTNGTGNDPNFKPIEFDGFKNEAVKNSFVLSPQRQTIREVAMK